MTIIIVSGTDLSARLLRSRSSVAGRAAAARGGAGDLTKSARAARGCPTGALIGLLTGAMIAALRLTPFIAHARHDGHRRGSAAMGLAMSGTKPVHPRAKRANQRLDDERSARLRAARGVWVALALAIAIPWSCGARCWAAGFALGSNRATAHLRRAGHAHEDFRLRPRWRLVRLRGCPSLPACGRVTRRWRSASKLDMITWP